MSKLLKKNVLKLVATIKKKSVIIDKLITLNRMNELIQILSECQQDAIKVGEILESSCENVSVIITDLEQYCELIYLISTMNQLQINKSNIWKSIYEILDRIEKNIRDNIDEKYEILFLPYKASMWDSLESIWSASKEDSRCETYVMPIPYYDKKDDGSLAKLNYEGDKFPDSVPIISYKNYKIELRMPDVIYIHNPYDQYNKVTTVHSDYYAKNLKIYTHMLIYVPYFMSMDDVETHFCVLPGTLYADKVIVQSEKIRNTYIKEYQEFTKMKNADEKFVALGSPKIDKVLYTKKTDIVIPNYWKEIISDKKVVLYNTSVQEIINEEYHIISKIKYVLECFKKRKDVVLLWRPHPLLLETLNAMLPELAMEYNNIVKKYKNENWGIYDDTSDFNRAIAISDAYYGDWSSVVPLYGMTQKPIMIQNTEIFRDFTETELYSLRFEDMVIDGDIAWFAASNTNGLFKMNTKTYQTEFVGKFPEEDENGVRLYSGIKKYKNKLIFAPMVANEIAIYDIKTDSFQKIKIKNNDFKYNSTLKFFSAVSYKNWMFIIGCSYPAIICINMENQSIDYYTDWVDELQKYMVDDEVFFLRPYIIDNVFYVASCNSNIVMEFNMQTCLYKLHRVGNCENTYSSICFDGNDFWIASRKKSKIIRWNKEIDEVQEICDIPKDFSNGTLSYRSILWCNGYIWAIPLCANMILKIDPKTNKINKVSNKQLLNDDNNLYKYSYADVINNNIILLSFQNQELIEYNLKLNKIEVHNILLPMTMRKMPEMMEKDFEKRLCSNGNHTMLESYIFENRNNNLKQYLDYVIKIQKTNYNKICLVNNIYETSGMKIHYYIINEYERESEKWNT